MPHRGRCASGSRGQRDTAHRADHPCADRGPLWARLVGKTFHTLKALLISWAKEGTARWKADPRRRKPIQRASGSQPGPYISQQGTSLVAQCKESTGRGRGRGLDLWSEKIPHASEQLSPHATASEPVLESRGTATAPMTTTAEARVTRACALQREGPPQ